jgi:hypothetical protein
MGFASQVNAPADEQNIATSNIFAPEGGMLSMVCHQLAGSQPREGGDGTLHTQMPDIFLNQRSESINRDAPPGFNRTFIDPLKEIYN